MLLDISSKSPKQQISLLNLDSRISLQTSKAYLNRRSNAMNKSSRCTHILDKLIEHPISTKIRSQLFASHSYSSDKKRYLNHTLEGNELSNLNKDIIHFTFAPQDHGRISSSPVRLSEEEDIEWDNVILPPKSMNISFGSKTMQCTDSKPTRPISGKRRRRIILIRKLAENEGEKTVVDQENQTDFTHSFQQLIPRPYDKARYFTPNRTQNTDQLKAISRFPSFEHHVKPNQQKHWIGRTLCSDIERLGLDRFRKMWQDKLNETHILKPVKKLNSKRLVINGNGINN